MMLTKHDPRTHTTIQPTNQPSKEGVDKSRPE